LAKKYHTDKAFFYAPYYDKLLASRRNDIKLVLEVGIGSLESMKDSISRAGWTTYQPGASLAMWREYFPLATIHGLDTDIDTLFVATRIRTHWGDSRIWTSGLRFDLIIDDGNHSVEAQLETRKNLLPLLAPGGIYITEDITGDWPYKTVSFQNEYGNATISVYP